MQKSHKCSYSSSLAVARLLLDQSRLSLNRLQINWENINSLGHQSLPQSNLLNLNSTKFYLCIIHFSISKSIHFTYITTHICIYILYTTWCIYGKNGKSKLLMMWQILYRCEIKSISFKLKILIECLIMLEI